MPKPNIMFNLFKKDPLKALQKQYDQVLEAAMQLQRNGDLKGYAAKMEEAAELERQIAELIQQKS
jgi:Family of unknown function (DUF6435)